MHRALGTVEDAFKPLFRISAFEGTELARRVSFLAYRVVGTFLQTVYSLDTDRSTLTIQASDQSI